MKRSEIKVGEEYAYSRHEWESRERVRVVGEARVQQGWTYRSKTVTGSRVQVLDSATGEPVVRKNAETGEEVPTFWNVPNRNIREAWASYAEREAQKRQSRLEHEALNKSRQQERGALVAELIPALRAAGFEDKSVTVFDAKVIAVLQIYVPTTLSDDDRLRDDAKSFTAPAARSLRDYVDKGSGILLTGPTLLALLKRGEA